MDSITRLSKKMAEEGVAERPVCCWDSRAQKGNIILILGITMYCLHFVNANSSKCIGISKNFVGVIDFRIWFGLSNASFDVCCITLKNQVGWSFDIPIGSTTRLGKKSVEEA